MGKDDRKGKRVGRNNRVGTRVPKLGYYIIVTDTEETEKNYFEGLRNSMPKEIQDQIVIKVEKASIKDLVDIAQELRNEDPQYRNSWIVFDRDQVKDFDEIIFKAGKIDINVGWSNPCIEIWFFAYFENIPHIKDSWTCCDNFAKLYLKKTGQNYEKSGKDIYAKLSQYGDEKKAIELSKRKIKELEDDCNTKPSIMYPGNTVFKLIEEIKSKINI
ncbi:RloB family protein [Proteocatella sphenisci]|uniref:RloB family protein n=1 Tax=Proteocatella sphenisci TaxID=181070 RepID=UPI00048DC882|nr:RloB family protein [Proteocatella sphenisci]